MRGAIPEFDEGGAAPPPDTTTPDLDGGGFGGGDTTPRLMPSRHGASRLAVTSAR
jgi:hypothetical protein